MPEPTKRERMHMPRADMPTRDPVERVGDFGEVSLGYTSALAVLEASRCLNCKRPVCIDGCPVGVRIDEFVRHVAEGAFDAAAEVIHEDNVLPSICGRVCPQEVQCEASCVLNKKGRPIAIGHLERFVADEERLRATNPPTSGAPPTGWRVAVVGSGPAGLACAGDLAAAGHEVVVFEALHELGGVLAYGIPEFRLPKDIVRAEVRSLEGRGVEFVTDVLVGVSPTIRELLDDEGFHAVFVGTGAGLPRFPGIPGEDLIGVSSANEFLTRVNLMDARDPEGRTPVYDLDGRPVVVIGGGNTAIDAARTAVRLGGDPVTILYRRTDAEMPARREEIEHAIEEGIAIRYLVAPTAFRGEDGWLRSVELQAMELGPPDDDGRRRPVPVTGSNESVDAEVAIVAIGNAPNPVLSSATEGLETSPWGTIVTDPHTGATSLRGVYAGGDVATGGATVILALAAGRRAATAIDEYLTSS